MLTCLVFSQQTCVDSFQVTVCATHCAVLTTWFPIHLIAFAIALALQIILGISQSILLAQPAPWPSILTWQVCIDYVLVPVASGTYLIISNAVDNICAV